MAGIATTKPSSVVTNASWIPSANSDGFGVVFEALHSQTGESVAIKRISLSNVGPAELADIQGEIELLKQLSHPNIVRYVDR